MSINCCSLVGRLTQNPELMHTKNGKAVVSFSLAVDKRKKDSGADFIPCKAWEALAEIICQYCQKGKQIAVSGRIESRSYKDKNGNNRTAIECVVSDFSFADSKMDATQYNPKTTDSDPSPVYGQQGEIRDYNSDDDNCDDDLPF